MTDIQPDRQNADGLLSREQITEYVRELNTIAAECEIVGKPELSRAAHNLYRIADRWFKSLATPSSSNGAEGGGLPWDAFANRHYEPVEKRAAEIYATYVYAGSDLSGKPDWTPHGNSDRQDSARAQARRELRAGGHIPSAPPQPAPDAMRSLLDEIRTIRETCGFINESEATRLGAIAERCDDILASPVPSPDGAGEAREIVTEWLGMFDPPPQIDFQQSEFLQQAIASALGIARTGKSRPPSGTEAAEPVAWRRVRNDGTVTYWESPVPDSIPLYAVPPVRDRDAIADDIRALGWTVAVHNDYRQAGQAYTFWLFTKDGRSIKGEGRTDADALNQVRAILSLSLQASAAEEKV